MQKSIINHKSKIINSSIPLRTICAAVGIAVAAGAVEFSASLATTNNAQAPMMASRATKPWAGWVIGSAPAGGGALALETIPLSIDYRPGDRVLQGPPMRALAALSPGENPYGAVELSEGRWLDEASAEPEVVCIKDSMRRFGAPAPALGSTLKFLGGKLTMSAKIVGYLDGAKLPRSFPTVFANKAAFELLAEEERSVITFFRELPPGADEKDGFFTPSSPQTVASYRSDEQRKMDYARPLMLVAAILTALSLLVNALLLSIESNRKELAMLRMAGLGKYGVVWLVTKEALATALAGYILGTVLAAAGLFAYVAFDQVTYPAGMVFDERAALWVLLALPVVVFGAILFALSPALRVRALDIRSIAPRSRCKGMMITFALGFAAFVAVEVWGASLMRAFVPSPEWPDAIVSLLPGGVSSFDIEKLQGIEGVKRISELLPLQVPLKTKAGERQVQIEPPPRRPDSRQGRRGGSFRGGPNALFLAAEWLPDFKFIEGDRESALHAIKDDGQVVITEMMSRAMGLHKGDALELSLGRPPRLETVSLTIAGVVDLNWHMVTSRGLVRGLNGMPVMTSGPVFASFDTVESLDMRPAQMVRMTHLWVEYDDAFLAANGVFPAGRKIEAQIAERLGSPVQATVRLHARDEIADGTLSHGSSVIGAAARVPFVFLAILSIGFLAMIVAEADARRKEFAVLRMAGATRLQIAALLTASAVKTALCGMAAGLVIGALAGWLVSFKTASIWPGLPHYFVVPWPIVFEGAIGATIFALVFAIPVSIFEVRGLGPSGH